jgi:hypothetical protein
MHKTHADFCTSLLAIAFGLLTLMGPGAQAAWQTLPTGTPGLPIARVSGSSIEAVDLISGLAIPPGAVINSSASGCAVTRYNVPPNFVLLASRSNPIVVNSVNVGTLNDYVYRYTVTNQLVFGFRVLLVANNFEINDLYRKGNTGYTALAGWSRATNADLRMYAGVRTATPTFFPAQTEFFDADTVKFQSDINSSEGNPCSGYFWLRSSAPNYKLLQDGIRIRRGGEEGQQVTDVSFAGFVPSAFPDNDGDGYDSSVDCNDNNPAVNPGAAEICGDGIDNNCSAGIDEPAACPVSVPFAPMPYLLGLGGLLCMAGTCARFRRGR